MKYLHDKTNRTVWCVEEPDVREQRETKTKRRPHPKLLGWSITMTEHCTRADNWLDPATHQWKHKVRFISTATYHYPQDDRASALQNFLTAHGFASGEEVSAAEYEGLRKEYEAEARSNVPPGEKSGRGAP